MDPHQPLQHRVYEIEANIECCDGCREYVEKRFWRLEGIESVSLHPEINKIIVVGNAHSRTILHEIRKKKPKARLLSERCTKQPAIEWAGDAYREQKDPKKTSSTNKATARVVPCNDDTSQHGALVAVGQRSSHLGGQTDVSNNQTTFNTVPPKQNSRKKDRIAAEATRFGVNVSVYGLFDAGIVYERDIAYK